MKTARLPIDIIREIEEELPVDKISIAGLPAWPFLRTAVFIHAALNLYGSAPPAQDSQTSLQKVRSKIPMIRDVFWAGLSFWARKPYWLVSNALEDRSFDSGTVINKIAWPICRELQSQLLYFHDPLGAAHPDKSQYAHPLMTSVAPLYALRAIFRRSMAHPRFVGHDVMTQVLDKCGFGFDYVQHCREFYALYLAAKTRIAFYRPRIIFFTCFETIANQAILYAAHHANCRVISLQHGFISVSHPSYQCYYAMDKKYLPDEHWVFGEAFARTIHPHIATASQIRIIGNSYLRLRIAGAEQDDEMRNKFSNLRKKFSKIVLVTLQDPVEQRVLEVIRRWSTIHPDTAFLCLPRVFRPDFHPQYLSRNLLVETDGDFYRLLPFVDFHCTAFSSCAIEALVAGIPNVLIDIDNLATYYLDKLLVNRSCSRYVSEDNSSTDLFARQTYASAEEIRQASLPFYAANESKLVREAVAASGE